MSHGGHHPPDAKINIERQNQPALIYVLAASSGFYQTGIIHALVLPLHYFVNENLADFHNHFK